MKSLVTSVLCLLSCVFISCGSDSDSDSAEETPKFGKCTLSVSGYNMCHYFSGWSNSGLTSAKADCESASGLGGAGTWVENTQASLAACSTVDKLGECSWASGSDTIVTVYNKSGSAPDQATAATACSSTWSGTWVNKTD